MLEIPAAALVFFVLCIFFKRVEKMGGGLRHGGGAMDGACFCAVSRINVLCLQCFKMCELFVCFVYVWPYRSTGMN